MSITKADLIEALKSLIFPDAKMREALRESIIDYLSLQSHLAGNLNDHALLRIGDFGAPGLHAYRGDAELFMPWNMVEGARDAVLLGQATGLYSRKQFGYGQYTFLAKLPLWTEPSWSTAYLCAEPSSGYPAGLLGFRFNRSTSKVYTLFGACAEKYSTGQDITSLVATPLPSGNYHTYMLKVNKASVDYYIDSNLVMIAQAVEEADGYVVRATDPYGLVQTVGIVPVYAPSLVEITATAVGDIGTRPGFYLMNIAAFNGQPAPLRTLHPYTGGTKWEGYTIVAPATNLTSDRVPVAGYDSREVPFRATVQGNLSLYADYGDNALEFLTAYAVAANKSLSIGPRHIPKDVLWIQLLYTPDSVPATVTRARVLMS